MHHDHNPAHRAALATPELAHVDPAGLAPLGTAGAAPLHVAPNDEGPTVAGSSLPEHTQDDATSIGHFAEERKAQSTLAAMLALRGFSLIEIACGGFLVARWDRTMHCSDLAQVRAFYRRAVGGAA